MTTVNGRFGLVPRKVRATSRSFQTPRNTKIVKDAMAGMVIGTAMRRNRVEWPAPSISADSKISLGRPPR